MKNNIYLLIVFLSFEVNAQKTIGGVAAGGLDMNTAIGGFISQIDLTNYDPIGNVYVNDNWENASVMLRNDKLIHGLDIRINLLKNVIDIKDKKAIRTFAIQKLKYIDLSVLNDSSVRYFNPFEYRFMDNTSVVGLLRKETYTNKTWNLAERSYLKIFEATYVKALDAGTKRDRYEVQKEMYLVKDNVLYPILPNKKKLANELGMEGGQKDEFVSYIKKNKINLKEYASGYKVLSYLNR